MIIALSLSLKEKLIVYLNVPNPDCSIVRGGDQLLFIDKFKLRDRLGVTFELSRDSTALETPSEDHTVIKTTKYC